MRVPEKIVERVESSIDAFPQSSRYRALDAISTGEMTTVYVGTLRGPNGFERRVAIKRAHTHLLGEPTTRKLLLDEARIASRVDHPNVIGVRDVEDLGGELLLVMDYVEGASLSRLLASGPIPLRVAGRILLDAATGLCAVHALAETGDPGLTIIHRDVSPSNILVGIDGTSRLADFGIAKGALAVCPGQNTASGALRGKPGYMAPEYVASGVQTPLLDVFAMGVVAWETLTAHRLFRGATDAEMAARVQAQAIPHPSELTVAIPPELDTIVLRALEREPARRCSAQAFKTALERALHDAGLLGARREVETLVQERCADVIRARRQRIRRAVAGTPGSRTLPELGRVPLRTATFAKLGARPLVAPQVPARELAGSLHSSARPFPKAIVPAAAMVCAVAFAVVGAHALSAPPHAVPPPEVQSGVVQVAPDVAPGPSRAPSTTLAAVALAAPALAPARVAAKPKSAAAVEASPAARPAPEAPVVADCETLSDLAGRRRAEHDLSGAEALYRQALSVNPRYLPARLAIADIEWEEGRTESAQSTYRTLIDQYAPELLPAYVLSRTSTRGNDPR